MRIFLKLLLGLAIVGTPNQLTARSSSMDTQSPAGITAWKTYLPRPSVAGDCLVITVQWGSSTVTASVADDQGNIWVPGPVAQDGGSNTSLQIFTALNVAVNTRRVTVTLSAQTLFAQVQLFSYNNIASVSAVDGTATAAVSTGTVLQSGSITTAVDGDLIFQVGCLHGAGGPNTPVVWTPDTGFKLAGPDGTALMCSQWGIQGTHGAINPSLTSSVSASFTLSCTIALKPGSGGGVFPPAGISANRIQYITFKGLLGTPNATSFIFQVPTVGNLLLLGNQGNDSARITGILDSNGNLWEKADGVAFASHHLDWWYAKNATPSESLTITPTFLTATGSEVAGSPCIYFVDVTGASTVPLDVTATSTGNSAAASGNITGAVLTPTVANGLLVSYQQNEGETVTAVTPGYIESVDIGQYGNNGAEKDGGLQVYYYPDTSQITTTWTYSNYELGVAIGNYFSVSAAFKAAVAGGGAGALEESGYFPSEPQTNPTVVSSW
jgi:hypothetical protein